MYWDRSQHIHFVGLARGASNGNVLGLPYPGAPSPGLGENLKEEVTSEERVKKCSLKVNM